MALSQQQPETVTITEYTRHISRLGNTDRYFQFHENYLDIMSRDAALVLQKLMNYCDYKANKNLLDRDGFVEVTVSFLQNSLRMNKDCQLRILRELQGMDADGKIIENAPKYIKIKRRGVPPKRYIKVDYLVLNRALDEAQTPKSEKTRSLEKHGKKGTSQRAGNPALYTAGFPARQYSENNSKTKTTNTHTADGGGVVCVRRNQLFPNEESCPIYLLAQRLYHTCRQKHVLSPLNLPRDGRTEEEIIVKWKTQLKRWMRRMKMSVGDVTCCMDALIPRLGERYLPEVTSMTSFCEKFDKLWVKVVLNKNGSIGSGSNGHSTNGNGYHASTSTITISPEAKKLSQTISRLSWSKDAGNDFDAIAQQSIINYKTFRSRLCKIAYTTKHKYHDFARQVLNMRFMETDSVAYLTRWYEQLCESYHNWDAWSGVLRPFTDDAKQLRSIGITLAREWSGKRELWDDFLKALREVQP